MASTSSPSRVAGVTAREVTLAGETYLLSQCDKVRKAADEESLVLSLRLDTLAAVVKACDALPPERQAEWKASCIDKMVCGIASPTEWRAYFESRWHTAFRLWSAMDPKHRGNRTLLEGARWAYEIVCGNDMTEEALDSLYVALQFVSQEGEIKNSSGSQQPGATQQTESPITEAGQPSTSSS